ncbi:hypothetical protein [Longimicrobium sp.]|uniref:hypothetical protein n=1 Tax=Longimicrobium sp. TaxID=2029185 RepID=UPI002E35F174|nr:hypothetical protein [Longimicrobium sp.]HEX6036501.1 hypothetical protein [Longimicrobium sp.]
MTSSNTTQRAQACPLGTRASRARAGTGRLARAAVCLCMLVPLAACPGTNTNPAVVRPNALLEVFASHHNLDIDVVANPDVTTPPPAEAKPYHPDDLTIRVTGTQLDRGLASMDLTVRASEPFECRWTNPDLGGGSTPATGPREIHVPQSNPPGSPTGILMFTYDIRDYLRQVNCGRPDATFGGRVELILTVTNVAGLRTQTPPLRLYICESCA